MDTCTALSETLKLCIERRCQQYGFTILLTLIIGVAELIQFYRQKRLPTPSNSKKNIEKRQKQIQRTKWVIFSAGALCIVLFVMGLVEILPAVHDLEEERFVQVTTTYHHPNHSAGRFHYLSDGFVKIEDGSRTLDLPPNWTEDAFPHGHYYGEIWYSEQSEFILSFAILEGKK